MKLTRRGEIVFMIGLAVLGALLLWGIYEVATQLWWTGSGYCWGSAVKCGL